MRIFFATIFTLFCFQSSLGQNSDSNIIAELKVETIEDISTIIARGLNRTQFYYNLRYVFTVVTFDKDYEQSQLSLEEFLRSEDVVEKTLEDFINSNDASKYSSKEKAEDFFSLDPYQSKDLFRMSLETGIENKIIVMLLLYDEDDNILATSRVIFNESTDEKESDVEVEAPLPRDNFELTGLVVEETLTKNGRDFYERFYFHYSYNEVKGDEVVVIDEMFTFRTRTRIKVKIGDEEIISFFGSSNEEYIDEMAKVSVQKVYQYFENKKKEKSYITRY